ncbi:hypothetical protein EDD18DRAFT_757975 [Armillaria luteobubalina]|uniref:DUF6534 domain-containing protein n=1 Tax=Armillaria luteobubalina TaxID=153913 RepID=A0AA39PEW7_9AGAR|nr:hypothetical protein EDD18DRAFT_757975 [Armillaria luteobubalina]
MPLIISRYHVSHSSGQISIGHLFLTPKSTTYRILTICSVVIPSIASTLGAVYLGSCVALVLYGITNLQTFLYYKRYSDDWWFYRYSVAVLWVFDTLHVILSTHALYFYLIESFGDYLGLIKIVWSFQLDVVLNNLVIVCVHIVYSVRLWMLGRHFHRVVPWFVVFIVLASCAAAILLSFEVFTISDFFQLHDISRTIEGALATAATVDIIIALSLCYYLLKCRVTTVFSSTTVRLMVILRFILISGLATTACSLIILITFLASPDTLIFAGISFIIPKLYINSLLAMFNTRGTKDHSSSISVPHRPFKVHDEERIINTIPLSTIGQGTTTSEDSINTGSKSELRFHGSV